jgi:hypothetical protein
LFDCDVGEVLFVFMFNRGEGIYSLFDCDVGEVLFVFMFNRGEGIYSLFDCDVGEILFVFFMFNRDELGLKFSIYHLYIKVFLFVSLLSKKTITCPATRHNSYSYVAFFFSYHSRRVIRVLHRRIHGHLRRRRTSKIHFHLRLQHPRISPIMKVGQTTSNSHVNTMFCKLLLQTIQYHRQGLRRFPNTKYQ